MPQCLGLTLHSSQTDDVSIDSHLLCVAVWLPGLYHAAGEVRNLGAIRPHFEAMDTENKACGYFATANWFNTTRDTWKSYLWKYIFHSFITVLSTSIIFVSREMQHTNFRRVWSEIESHQARLPQLIHLAVLGGFAEDPYAFKQRTWCKKMKQSDRCRVSSSIVYCRWSWRYSNLLVITKSLELLAPIFPLPWRQKNWWWIVSFDILVRVCVSVTAVACYRCFVVVSISLRVAVEVVFAIEYHS